MNRLLPFVILLSLVTGVVAGQLFTLASGRVPASVQPEPRATEIAETFYDGLNQVLANGDASLLLSVLDNAFVDHSLSDGPGTDAERFEAWLRTLATASPGLQIDATSTTVEGGLVLSTVYFDTANVETRLSTTPSVYQPDTMHDLIRIEKNRVAERWTAPTADQLGLITPIAVADFDTESVPQHITFERFTLPRNARLEVPVHRGTILLIEAGTVELGLRSVLGNPGAAVRSLRDGETAVIPASEAFWLRNSQLESAALFRLTLHMIAPAVPRSSSPSNSSSNVTYGDDIERQLLSFGSAFKGVEAQIQVRIEKVLLGAGASIIGHLVSEAELAVVIDGSLETVVRKGSIGLITEAGTMRRQQTPEVLQPGAALFAYAGSNIGYRPVDGSSATLLLITITS